MKKKIFIYEPGEFGHHSVATDDPEADWNAYWDGVKNDFQPDDDETWDEGYARLHEEFLNCFRELNPNDSDDIKLALENGIINAAQAMRMKPSEKRSQTSRDNGRLGGRPRKTQPTQHEADGEAE